MGCIPIRLCLPIFFLACFPVLADSVSSTDPAEAPPAVAEAAGWHFSRYTGDGRAWFPEDQFSNEPQKAPFMVMYEVSRFPFRLQPTAAEKAAGQELIERARARRKTRAGSTSRPPEPPVSSSSSGTRSTTSTASTCETAGLSTPSVPSS